MAGGGGSGKTLGMVPWKVLIEATDDPRVWSVSGKTPHADPGMKPPVINVPHEGGIEELLRTIVSDEEIVDLGLVWCFLDRTKTRVLVSGLPAADLEVCAGCGGSGQIVLFTSVAACEICGGSGRDWPIHVPAVQFFLKT